MNVELKNKNEKKTRQHSFDYQPALPQVSALLFMLLLVFLELILPSYEQDRCRGVCALLLALCVVKQPERCSSKQQHHRSRSLGRPDPQQSSTRPPHTFFLNMYTSAQETAAGAREP